MAESTQSKKQDAREGRTSKPPVEEKPYRLIFEGNLCIGAGKCAEVSENWSMDLRNGLARADEYFVDEDELQENLDAVRVCPAKKGVGVIHVVDRRTGREIAPDPYGDGTLSMGREAARFGDLE